MIYFKYGDVVQLQIAGGEDFSNLNKKGEGAHNDIMTTSKVDSRTLMSRTWFACQFVYSETFEEASLPEEKK